MKLGIRDEAAGQQDAAAPLRYSWGVGDGLGCGLSVGGLPPLVELELESSPEGVESRFLSFGGPSFVVDEPPESDPRPLSSPATSG